MIGSSHKILARLIVTALAAAALAFGGFALAGTDTYHYDAYGRLVSVTYADGSSITYTYDPAGNRTVLTATP